MPNLTGRTGNATIDRQNREFARGGQVVTVEITGQARTVYKTVPHLLGYVPSRWKQVGGPDGITEPPDGIRATRNDVTLQFACNGRFVVELS